MVDSPFPTPVSGSENLLPQGFFFKEKSGRIVPINSLREMKKKHSND